jgi:hypothetical protein
LSAQADEQRRQALFSSSGAISITSVSGRLPVLQPPD